MVKAKRNLNSASSALSSEQAASPSINQLKSKLAKMIKRRDNNNQGYLKVENRYGRLEVRTEKCLNMQYAAKKASTFKKSLIAFAQDNGAGCNSAVSRLNNTRGKAKRAGVTEAHELICKSDLLVREVEVQVEGPQVQCNDSTSSYDNSERTLTSSLRIDLSLTLNSLTLLL